jgi:uncharacterized Rmd1/YagE family protein
MTGQDVFYYEYGTVVFWGLSPLEEKAAITELGPFVGVLLSYDLLSNITILLITSHHL